ncbi:hypothetical protein [Paenibacillus sp. IHBB 3054]|uniref:hypothetical protein n=1 Tax=Paenibacillus sp. IHBB 3054 TaxID=3425689 RepID=UPI003F667E25
MKCVVQNPSERHRLRKALNVQYRKQADVIRLYGIPSAQIAGQIKKLLEELKAYDEKPSKPEKSRNPRRLKRPWYCSNPECDNTIPDGKEKIMLKKRHYCSHKCAFMDTGILPEIPGNRQNIKESKGSVGDG